MEFEKKENYEQIIDGASIQKEHYIIHLLVF